LLEQRRETHNAESERKACPPGIDFEVASRGHPVFTVFTALQISVVPSSMIQFSDLLSPDRVLCNCNLKSKKRALQTLAELLARTLNSEEVSEMDILDALISREKLGSTGLGHGIALPHGRIQGLDAPLAAIITLEEGVDFGSPDDQLVDLMTGLIVPENCDQEHLEILANLAKIFNQPDLRQEMRQTQEPDQLLNVFLKNSNTTLGINGQNPNQAIDSDGSESPHSRARDHQTPDARTN